MNLNTKVNDAISNVAGKEARRQKLIWEIRVNTARDGGSGSAMLEEELAVATSELEAAKRELAAAKVEALKSWNIDPQIGEALDGTTITEAEFEAAQENLHREFTEANPS